MLANSGPVGLDPDVLSARLAESMDAEDDQSGMRLLASRLERVRREALQAALRIDSLAAKFPQGEDRVEAATVAYRLREACR